MEPGLGRARFCSVIFVLSFLSLVRPVGAGEG